MGSDRQDCTSARSAESEAFYALIAKMNRHPKLTEDNLSATTILGELGDLQRFRIPVN
jgi:hypothetical protein